MPTFQIALFWRATSLTDHLPDRLGQTKIFPLWQVSLLLGMHFVTFFFSPKRWSLILILHQPHGRQGQGRRQCKGQWEEKTELLLHPPHLSNWGLLAVGKTWQVVGGGGMWLWQQGRIWVKEEEKICPSCHLFQKPCSSFHSLSCYFTHLSFHSHHQSLTLLFSFISLLPQSLNPYT